MSLTIEIIPSNSKTNWILSARDNGTVFYENNINQNTVISYDTEVEGQHKIELEISGKQPQDTVVDAQGNIIEDSILSINLRVLGIRLNDILADNIKYVHDFNGVGQQVVENFYQFAGCNGKIKFEIGVPYERWLLNQIY